MKNNLFYAFSSADLIYKPVCRGDMVYSFGAACETIRIKITSINVYILSLMSYLSYLSISYLVGIHCRRYDNTTSNDSCLLLSGTPYADNLEWSGVRCDRALELTQYVCQFTELSPGEATSDLRHVIINVDQRVQVCIRDRDYHDLSAPIITDNCPTPDDDKAWIKATYTCMTGRVTFQYVYWPNEYPRRQEACQNTDTISKQLTLLLQEECTTYADAEFGICMIVLQYTPKVRGDMGEDALAVKIAMKGSITVGKVECWPNWLAVQGTCVFLQTVKHSRNGVANLDKEVKAGMETIIKVLLDILPNWVTRDNGSGGLRTHNNNEGRWEPLHVHVYQAKPMHPKKGNALYPPSPSIAAKCG